MSLAKGWLFAIGFICFSVFKIAEVNAQAARNLNDKISSIIQIPTISYLDSNQTDWKAFDALQQLLAQDFPLVHGHLERRIIGGHSLLFTWNGVHPEAQPVMYYAHQDVVPVESEDGSGWTYSPFSGTIEGGYIWGRGALDTKSLIVCQLEAVERLLAAGFQPSNTIYLAYGHDEEVGGNGGAAKIAAYLEAQQIRLAWVLDEGLSVILGAFHDSDPPVALVGLAEKGQANIQLKVRGDGGHSAAPPKETVIGLLSVALDRIQKHPMDDHLLPLVMESLKHAAPLMDKKTQLAMNNVRLLKPLIMKALANDPRTDAVIRTKISPTIIQGGVKNNVLPKEAYANLNVRTMPGDSIADVMAHIKKTINDERVLVTLMPDPTEASPVSSHHSPAFLQLHATIEDIYPGAIVSPALMPAGTDSKHFTQLSKNLYRFSPFCIHKDEASRIHNTDERIAVAAIPDILAFYMLLFQLPSPSSDEDLPRRIERKLD